MMYGYHGGFGPGMFFLSPIGILLLIIVGVSIYALFGGRRPERGEDRAMEALRSRFARGEITEEQFNEMKQVLKR